MVDHFYHSFATSMKASVHIDVIRGTNAHHQVESSFKALALAMKMAISKSTHNEIPSTKGVL